MKIVNLFMTILIATSIISCGGENKVDSDANNIGTERETSQESEQSNKGSAVQSMNINEDMTLDNSEIIELPSDRLRESIAANLQNKGKTIGTVNGDGSIYIIGTASTGIPSNKNGFINSRNIAFAKAELRAKIELLKLSGEVITSERNSTLIAKNMQGDDPDAKQKATMLEKSAAVADKSLDKALEYLGVSGGEIAKMNEGQKEKTYNETFYNYVSSFVASMIKGVTVVKVVEGEVGSNDYEVAVCIKYSPEQQSAAANKNNLGASQQTLNSKVVNNIKTINPDKLVSKLGAQMYKDENGNTFILGFGQSAIRNTETRQSNFVNIARKKARLQAVENIKNFLAEDLVGKEISETTEKITEFSDGTNGIYTMDNYTELIKSKKSSVKLNTLKVRDWDGTHPVSNTRVVGAIVILTESNDVKLKPAKIKNQEKTKKSDYIESEKIEGEEM